MRITNVKITTREILKKYIKNIICCGLAGTIIGISSGLAEKIETGPRLRSMVSQKTDYNLECNDLPLGVTLYTGDYVEKSYTVYSKEDEEEIDSDDLIITVNTNSVKDERSGLYTKRRYRLHFLGVKIGELTEDEINLKSREALINIINGFDLGDVEVLSEEYIIIKSLEEIEEDDFDNEIDEVELNVSDSSENHPMDTPVESLPVLPKKSLFEKVVLILAGLGGAVWMASDLIHGDTKSTKHEEKRYIKRGKDR